jgi:hypothetical protein
MRAAAHAMPSSNRWNNNVTAIRKGRVSYWLRVNAHHFNPYHWAAAGFFDAAWFVHSSFSGLMATSFSILVIQWMVARARG